VEWILETSNTPACAPKAEAPQAGQGFELPHYAMIAVHTTSAISAQFWILMLEPLAGSLSFQLKCGQSHRPLYNMCGKQEMNLFIDSTFLIDWISDTLSQGYTNLQSLVKCLDHRLNLVIFISSSGISAACVRHVRILPCV